MRTYGSALQMYHIQRRCVFFPRNFSRRISEEIYERLKQQEQPAIGIHKTAIIAFDQKNPTVAY